MPGSYSITAEPARDLIQITLAGFFDAGSLAGFDAARRRAHDALRCAANQHCTMVDVRDCKLQAQDMVEAFRAMIAAPATRARRLAFVTGDAAVRMQVRRLLDRPDIRCFEDAAHARAWLLEPPAGFALAG